MINLSGIVAQAGGTLPAGTYAATIDAVETKNTKANDGKYLEVWFKISNGAFAGRKVKHRFNIENKSQKAREIGLGELKHLATCVGISGDQLDEKSLIGKQVGLKTKVKVDEDREFAEVKSFLLFDQAPVESSPKKAF
jgi:hypothetical protein